MDENEFHIAVITQLGEMVKAQHDTTRAVAASIAEAMKPLVALAADIAVLNERTKELHTPLNCPLRGDLSMLEKVVQSIQLREAWRSGAYAAIGGIIVLIGQEGISWLLTVPPAR